MYNFALVVADKKQKKITHIIINFLIFICYEKVFYISTFGSRCTCWL